MTITPTNIHILNQTPITNEEKTTIIKGVIDTAKQLHVYPPILLAPIFIFVGLGIPQDKQDDWNIVLLALGVSQQLGWEDVIPDNNPYKKLIIRSHNFVKENHSWL